MAAIVQRKALKGQFMKRSHHLEPLMSNHVFLPTGHSLTKEIIETWFREHKPEHTPILETNHGSLSTLDWR
jgi:hypothetical protein